MKHMTLSLGLAFLILAVPAAIFLASRSGTREISDSQRALEERVRSVDESFARIL